MSENSALPITKEEKLGMLGLAKQGTFGDVSEAKPGKFDVKVRPRGRRRRRRVCVWFHGRCLCSCRASDAARPRRSQGRVKWEAWESRKGMAQDEAKAAHIKCAGRRRRRPPPPRAPALSRALTPARARPAGWSPRSRPSTTRERGWLSLFSPKAAFFPLPSKTLLFKSPLPRAPKPFALWYFATLAQL